MSHAKPTCLTDKELIDKAIADGKLRRFPVGHTSDWEEHRIAMHRERMIRVQKDKGRRLAVMKANRSRRAKAPSL